MKAQCSLDMMIAGYRIDNSVLDMLIARSRLLLPRERMILRRRLTSAPEDRLTYAKLALRFKVTRERIRQIERRGWKKLSKEFLCGHEFKRWEEQE